MKTAKQKFFAVLALLLAMTMIFCACGQKKDAKTEETEESETVAETAKTPADTDVPEPDDDDDDVDEVELDGDFILDVKNADVSAFAEAMFNSMGDDDVVDLIKDNVDSDVAEKFVKKFCKALTFSFDADEGTVTFGVEADDAADAVVDFITDAMNSIPIEAFAEQAGLSVEEMEAKLEEMGTTWDKFWGELVSDLKDELKDGFAESFENIDDNSDEFTLKGDKLTIGKGDEEITLTLKAVKGGFEIQKCKVDESNPDAEAVKLMFPEGAVLKQK